MILLAIDTSCDETSAAVLDNGKVLSNIVWSQIKIHQKWGGVVPNLARRAHEKRLPAVVFTALSRYNNYKNYNPYKSYSPPSAIAVTVGPGLAPALEVGIHYAKQFALANKIPLIPVNHLEGHLASVFLRNRVGKYYVDSIRGVDAGHGSGKRITGASVFLRRRFASYFTNNDLRLTNNGFLNLIVSGGHTELVLSSLPNSLKSPNSPNSPAVSHCLLGQTLDDAAGECLDKVGRELGLGYPAAPVIERFASEFARTNLPNKTNLSNLTNSFVFPVALLRSPKTDLNFSFSGLKSAAIRNLSGLGNLSNLQTLAFCFAFQQAVIESILLKLRRAVIQTGIKIVCLSGGVAANNQLRRAVSREMKKLGVETHLAPKKFTGDNAAMIGLAALWAFNRGEYAKTKEEIAKIDRLPGLNFGFAAQSPQIPQTP